MRRGINTWIDFYHCFLITFFTCVSFFIIIYFIEDIFYILLSALEDDDDSEFKEILASYNTDIKNTTIIFDLNHDGFDVDKNIFMRALIDNFNKNYLFPLYNYFYPSSDPAYSFFFNSRLGLPVALIEFAIEDIGTDMIYVGTSIIEFLKSLVDEDVNVDVDKSVNVDKDKDVDEDKNVDE